MRTFNQSRKYQKHKQPSAEIREELDFQYLLQLMGPLHNEEQFYSLPELFSIIGVDKLILLCKYAGGETIRIPTIEELSHSIEALEWYYDVYITHKKQPSDIPIGFKPLVDIILSVYSE